LIHDKFCSLNEFIEVSKLTKYSYGFSSPLLSLVLAVLTSFFLFFDPFIQHADSHTLGLMPADASTLENALLIFSLAFIASTLICALLVRYAHLHVHLTGDPFTAKPQAFHLEATPRIAGIAIFMAALIGCASIGSYGEPYKNFLFLALMVCSIPVFCGGLIEDIFKNVGVRQRLMLTMISAVMAACMVDKGFIVYRADVGWIDQLLTIEVVSLLFTLLVVSGLTNAINLIDGYNGLAGGVMVIALTAITVAACLLNDAVVAANSLIMIAAILGFLMWNWPRGKIFLGDGGSYFIGFISAELCLLLLHHNPTVSPWFPLAIFIHPVIETVFTMFRRTFIHKTSNTAPDDSHLHQLIFKFLANKKQCALGKNQAKNSRSDGDAHQIKDPCPTQMRMKNNRVAPYIWVATAVNAGLAITFMHSTAMLMALCLSACVIYVLAYFFLASRTADINPNSRTSSLRLDA
jgi:UDP-GlcNAc:undecaprenyl-phosphate GlcNAc-1-phosphate transferase